MRRSREQVRFAAAAVVLAVFLAAVALVPLALPGDVNTTNLMQAYKAPGVDGHLLGTDNLGRDVLMRVLAGGGESVLTALLVVALSLVVGLAVGLTAGFFGGAVDAVLAKVITVFQAFPSFVLAVAVAGILGPGTANMVLAIVAAYWTQFARLARSLVLAVRDTPSVRAARVCGAGPVAILAKYLLPQVVTSLVVTAALSVGDVVLTMAGLSFLGLGPQRPTNEWGAIMSEARSLLQIAPWIILSAGCALLVAVVVFNLFGDALRDLLDARGRHARVAEKPAGEKPTPTSEPTGNPSRSQAPSGACHTVRKEQQT